MGTQHQVAKHSHAPIHKKGAAVHKSGGEAGGAMESVMGLLHEALRSKDTSIPALTLYVQEDIGVGGFLQKELNPRDRLSGQITGVYVPPSVKPDKTLNVILYMHGDKVRIWDQTGTIRDYWSLPQLPLRQGLSASKQPFILVAPTLGKKASREFGDLGAKIDSHLDHIMAALHKLGAPEFPLDQPPEVGRLIIAGHSGAFGPMRDILKSIKKYKDNIKEIWAFDTMYIDLLPLLGHFPGPVYAYWVEGTDTDDFSRRLAQSKRPNTFVMENVDFDIVKGKEKRRSIKHDLLMQRFWADRCRRIGTNGSDPDDRKRMVRR